MKSLIFVALLAASIAIPYFVFSGSSGGLFQSWKSSGDGSIPAATYTAIDPDDDGIPRVLPDQLDRMREPAELAPVQSLEDALDFRVTPPWVLGSWPNVTTGLRDRELFGYRVPLVTGTGDESVTGALTYYFGPSQRLEKVTLQGDTGDARKLVTIVTSRYGLERTVTDRREYLYRRIDKSKAVSELRIRPDTVVRAAAPYQRFAISMVLYRPPEEGSRSWFGW